MRMHVLHARARYPFHQHLDGAVRQLQKLQNLRQSAYRVQIGGTRVVGLRGGLRHQQNAFIPFHGNIECANGFFAPHEQRDHHMREHHHVTQWQHWQDGGSRVSGGRHAGSPSTALQSQCLTRLWGCCRRVASIFAKAEKQSANQYVTLPKNKQAARRRLEGATSRQLNRLLPPWPGHFGRSDRARTCARSRIHPLPPC